ncbi:TPA: phosphate ABC transporter ATP-binding protein [bacterium]|nr:phosphate ABC transporter ATP-binding protein [bacterium]
MEEREKESSSGVKIKAEGVNLYYGRFQALKDVNLEIKERMITSIIGPSGCGKSTLLRCFNRMNDLIDGVRTTGSIVINDQEIMDKKIDLIKLRKKVGMVFQRPNPFPFSIFENIAYGPKVHGQTDKNRLSEMTEESLRSVGLWDEVKDKLRNSALDLSLGQQQRLCIARLLVVKPEVLLMDEPCSALDPIATEGIEELLHSLKKDYTIVIVTHNMQQAARISDETGFMLLGELIEFGSTVKIFTTPSDTRTENYITGRFG